MDFEDFFRCIFFPLLFVLIILQHFYDQRKWSSEMNQIVAELRFSWQEKVKWTDFQADILGYHLLTRGNNPRVSNVMQGDVDGIPLILFEYRYDPDWGKASSYHRQTVILFPAVQRDLPTFTLRPASLWHHLASKIGYQKIEFGHYRSFARHYLLQGPQEEDIRELFTVAILRYLEQEQNRDISIEGTDTMLLFYVPGKLVAPAALPAFIERGIEVLNLFTREHPVPMKKTLI